MSNIRRVLSNADAFLSLSRFEVPPPFMLDIDLSDSCNQDCIFCIDRDIRRKNIYLPKKLILSLLEEAKTMGVRSVVLKGGGEPLLHPDILDILRFIRAKGFAVGLETNASMLFGNISVEVGKTCKWVRASVNAADKQLFDFIHRPKEQNAFNVVLSNLANFRKHFQSVVTSISFVFCNENIHHIYEIGKISKDIGLNRIYFKPVIFHATLVRPFSNTTLHRAWLRKSILRASLISQKNKLKKLICKDFEVFFNNRKEISSTYKKCLSHQLIAVIRSDGTLYPCCFLKHDKSFSFGSLNSHGLINLWHGPRRMSIINKLAMGDCPRYCLNVGSDRANRYWEYNKILWNLSPGTFPDTDFL